MIDQFKKTVIRMSFAAVLDQLKKALRREGFELGGVMEFQHRDEHDTKRTYSQYQVLSVYNPFLSSEMVKISPFEGIILPCFVSVIEIVPGEIALVPVNTTEAIVRDIHSPSLQNLAEETTRRLTKAIHALEKEQTGPPDLVTSWE